MKDDVKPLYPLFVNYLEAVDAAFVAWTEFNQSNHDEELKCKAYAAKDHRRDVLASLMSKLKPLGYTSLVEAFS